MSAIDARTPRLGLWVLLLVSLFALAPTTFPGYWQGIDGFVPVFNVTHSAAVAGVATTPDLWRGTGTRRVFACPTAAAAGRFTRRSRTHFPGAGAAVGGAGRLRLVDRALWRPHGCAGRHSLSAAAAGTGDCLCAGQSGRCLDRGAIAAGAGRAGDIRRGAVADVGRGGCIERAVDVADSSRAGVAGHAVVNRLCGLGRAFALGAPGGGGERRGRTRRLDLGLVDTRTCAGCLCRTFSVLQSTALWRRANCAQCARPARCLSLSFGDGGAELYAVGVVALAATDWRAQRGQRPCTGCWSSVASPARCCCCSRWMWRPRCGP